MKCSMVGGQPALPLPPHRLPNTHKEVTSSGCYGNRRSMDGSKPSLAKSSLPPKGERGELEKTSARGDCIYPEHHVSTSFLHSRKLAHKEIHLCSIDFNLLFFILHPREYVVYLKGVENAPPNVQISLISIIWKYF